MAEPCRRPLVNVSLIQFHGDETAGHCADIAAQVRRPFVRAYRVKPDTVPSEDGAGEQRNIDCGFCRRDPGGHELGPRPGQLLVQGECVVSQ